MTATPLDLERGLKAHMARARANGCHPDGVIRAGKLYLSMVERRVREVQARERLEAVLRRLELQSPQGKAAGTKLRIELLEEMLEQVSYHPRIRGNGVHGGGGKAFAGLAREKRRSLRRFIEDIGGSAADGGYATDLLDFEPHHVERALVLTRGEDEPATDAERAALERWEAKHGPVARTTSVNVDEPDGLVVEDAP